jgi:eukaryotic-like serine/threonine-protein kinase
MVELRQAVDGGIKPLEDYRTDPNLDPLRGREDFRALLMDLAFPVDSLAP